MGLVGFLKFAFKCFDLLAWPLFGLGCPLYASIRAIENNSNLEMRNLVAYWILFSLVSLFEIAFVKLIDWLPVWPYMKLMAMCFFVLPDFNGASYVYECLLRPCISVDPRAAIKYFIKPKEEKLFLALAERYVQENGSEALERALEKFLDRESKHMKPDVGVEEIKAITYTEEKGTATAIQSEYEEPNVGKVDAILVAAMKLSNVKEPRVGKENATMGQLKDESPAVATEQSKHTKLDSGVEVMKAITYTEENETAAAIQSNYEETNADKVDATTVELPERSLLAPTKLSQVKDPHVNKENANAGALKDESPAVTAEQVKCVELNLAKNEKKMVATGKIKEKTEATAGGESKAMEITDSEEVQREWTCALCQVTTISEKTFDSHLQGRRHKAQELKASNQVNKNGASTSSVASPEPEETPSAVNENGTKIQEYRFQCTICDVKMHSEILLADHLGGKKHLSKTQRHIIDTLGGG